MLKWRSEDRISSYVKTGGLIFSAILIKFLFEPETINVKLNRPLSTGYSIYSSSEGVSSNETNLGTRKKKPELSHASFSTEN